MSSNLHSSARTCLRSGLCINIPTPDSSLERAETPHISHHAMSCTSASTTDTQPTIVQTTSDTYSTKIRRPHISLRSSTGMQGLLLAETGSGLVELDPHGGGSGFKQGTMLMPGLVTPRGGSSGVHSLHDRNPHGRSRTCPIAKCSQRLSRQATLLSQGVTPARNAAELKSLLGNSRSKVKSGAKLLPPPDLPHSDTLAEPILPAVALEQGKSRARVEVDILLDSEICVEGGYLTGRLHVKIRKCRSKEALALVSEGKMRVVGFEGIPDNNDRHTFFQHAAPLSMISPSSHALYASSPDSEGFSPAREGQHTIAFAMRLPVSDGARVGAKGPFDNRCGVIVKYIAIASFKLKDSITFKHSVAHFYRSCEIYPYFNSSVVLAPASRPLLSTAAQSLFLGGPGKLKLTASLHRNMWVAGQRCCLRIAVDNESKKVVKGLTLSLIRTTTVFKPHPHLNAASPSSADPDACQTTTTHKLVAEATLEAGQRGLKGRVSAKGWWIGVDPGVRTNFTYFIIIPHDALSIVRSRLVQVEYAIRVSLIAGSLSPEVSVMLPLRIISHLSIDPPPNYPNTSNSPDLRAPAPHPPIPISDSEPVFSNCPVMSSWEIKHDVEHDAARADLGRLVTMLEESSRRDGGNEARTAVDLAGVLETDFKPPLCWTSSNLPKLDEEDSGTGDTGRCFPPAPRSNLCGGGGGSKDEGHLRMTLEVNPDEDFSDSSGAGDITEEIDGDGLSLNFLRGLDAANSDEGVSAIGSARLDDNDDHNPSSSDHKATVSAFTHSRVMPLNPQSIHGNDAQASSENIPSTLPNNLAPCKHGVRCRIRVPGSILSSSTLEKALPSSSYEPASAFSSRPHEARENVVPVSSIQSEQSPERSWENITHFSQRVDRLMAARRVAAVTSTNSAAVSANDQNDELAINMTGADISPGPPSILSGRIFTSSLKISRIPERTPFNSQVITSIRSTTGSLSGSVRSRVAELEGRATGAAAATVKMPVRAEDTS